jgi:Mn2+/Fe2+ NRAMP family transporter
MTPRDKIVGALLLIIGSLVIAVAFRPDLRSRFSDFALFTTLSAILIIAGAYHLATARSRAERYSQQLAGASPLRRLWFPVRFYTSKNLLWQFHVSGGITILSGLMTAFVAFLAYHRGW